MAGTPFTRAISLQNKYVNRRQTGICGEYFTSRMVGTLPFLVRWWMVTPETSTPAVLLRMYPMKSCRYQRVRGTVALLTQVHHSQIGRSLHVDFFVPLRPYATRNVLVRPPQRTTFLVFDVLRLVAIQRPVTDPWTETVSRRVYFSVTCQDPPDFRYATHHCGISQ